MKPEKPDFIKKAIRSGDSGLLSAAGKKGAEMKQAYKEVQAGTVLIDSLEKEIKYWKDFLENNLHITDTNGEPMPEDYNERVNDHLEDLKARLQELRGH